LVDDFRVRISDSFSLQGSCALILPFDRVWSRRTLASCFEEALTYHRRKAITIVDSCAERIDKHRSTGEEIGLQGGTFEMMPIAARPLSSRQATRSITDVDTAP